MKEEPLIHITDNDDGSGDATVSLSHGNYRFSIRSEGNEAVIEYEETQSWRGRIQIAEPEEWIFKEILSSEELTSFLEANDLEKAVALHHGARIGGLRQT